MFILILLNQNVIAQKARIYNDKVIIRNNSDYTLRYIVSNINNITVDTLYIQPKKERTLLNVTSDKSDIRKSNIVMDYDLNSYRLDIMREQNRIRRNSNIIAFIVGLDEALNDGKLKSAIDVIKAGISDGYKGKSFDEWFLEIVEILEKRKLYDEIDDPLIRGLLAYTIELEKTGENINVNLEENIQMLGYNKKIKLSNLLVTKLFNPVSLELGFPVGEKYKYIGRSDFDYGDLIYPIIPYNIKLFFNFKQDLGINGGVKSIVLSSSQSSFLYDSSSADSVFSDNKGYSFRNIDLSYGLEVPLNFNNNQYNHDSSFAFKFAFDFGISSTFINRYSYEMHDSNIESISKNSSFQDFSLYYFASFASKLSFKYIQVLARYTINSNPDYYRSVFNVGLSVPLFYHTKYY
ncbi:hypothetical protein CA2015_2935 [Cyclobacterium amurskyense]|uniref:Uncharacterized protein n=2 Tax=Cyclobacterium amurskyense TaxID=320787 RepID=A0A0H4PH05_9BACT|nr:hypothetical protein CA2015_2935 [Cyclobacterium amurskyense]